MKNNFRITALCVTAALIASFFAVQTSAAPIVKHEKIVAKDGSGDYLTITAALAAISDASPSNRYVIKVRPGEYDEDFSMKAYVDITGSGQDNTVITRTTDTTQVVITADQTTIENIKITTASLWNNLVTVPANAETTFRNVTLTMPDGADAQHYINCNASNSTVNLIQSKILSDGVLTHNGSLVIYADNGTSSINIIDSQIDLYSTGNIYAIMPGKDLVIRNSDIRLIAATPNVIYSYGQKINIYDSTIYAESPGSGSHTLDITNNGELGIYNSRITTVAASGLYYESIGIHGAVATINNSTIESSGRGISLSGVNDYAHINNSVISGNTMGISVSGSARFKIGASQIMGGHNGVAPSKVVNCHDENYNPIPNL